MIKNNIRQPYHTGAVYLNRHWLKETTHKSSVLGGDAADESESELKALAEQLNQTMPNSGRMGVTGLHPYEIKIT